MAHHESTEGSSGEPPRIAEPVPRWRTQAGLLPESGTQAPPARLSLGFLLALFTGCCVVLAMSRTLLPGSSAGEWPRALLALFLGAYWAGGAAVLLRWWRRRAAEKEPGEVLLAGGSLLLLLFVVMLWESSWHRVPPVAALRLATALLWIGATLLARLPEPWRGIFLGYGLYQVLPQLVGAVPEFGPLGVAALEIAQPMLITMLLLNAHFFSRRRFGWYHRLGIGMWMGWEWLRLVLRAIGYF